MLLENEQFCVIVHDPYKVEYEFAVFGLFTNTEEAEAWIESCADNTVNYTITNFNKFIYPENFDGIYS